MNGYYKPSHRSMILAVDEAPLNLSLISNLLNRDYKVKIANNCEHALKIAADPQPDLILLDVMMPGMDRYEVCRRLKKDHSTRHIPVIFLSSRAEMDDEQKGLELGAVDYVTKPISPSIFIARFKNYAIALRFADSERDMDQKKYDQSQTAFHG